MRTPTRERHHSFCSGALGLVLLLIPGQIPANVVLPAKTEIFIALGRTIDSRVAQSGDRFHARVEVPVTQQDRVVVPAGSTLIGHVSRSSGAGRVKGRARLLLVFDTAILPSGVTRHLHALVQSTETYRTRASDEQGVVEGTGSQSRETAAGAARGAAGGAVVGVLAGGDFKGLGLGAAIGSGVGGLLGLFKKGEEVVLRKGTSLTIQLQSDVELVAPAPRSGTPLKPRRP